MTTAPKRLEAKPISDAELVERSLTHDRWARGKLYDRHAGALAAAVSRILGRKDPALDIVHDSFLYAFEHLTDLRDKTRFRSWLFRIAISRTRSSLRKEGLRRRLGFVAPYDCSLELMVGIDAGQEAFVELRQLDQALAALSADERIAWFLRHVEKHSMGDIATQCGWSLSTAKRRVFSATERIDRRLGRGQGRRG